MMDEEQASPNETTPNLPTVEEGVPTVPAPIEHTNGLALGSVHPLGLKNPKKLDKKLSIVSTQYDRSGKGYLDETELALRKLDEANRGYLDMDKVFFLMEELQKEQKANLNLKKAVAALAVFAIILALANMGTAFAAATLAKDTRVDPTGDLVDKVTGERLGTTAKKDVYEVIPGTDVINTDEDDDIPRLINKEDAIKIWSDCDDGGSGVRLMEDCGRDGTPDTPTDLACTRRTESFDNESTKRTVFQFTARRPEGAAFGTVSMVCREGESSSSGQCDVVGMTCNDVCPDGLVCGKGQICCCNRCVGEMDICNRAWCGTGDEMLEPPI